MRAIGGANFLKFRAGTRHDIGHAESAANLDQLAARDHDFAAHGKGIEHEQNGAGVVVNEGCVLRTGEFANQSAQMIVALAAFAGREIELKGDRRPHRRDSGLDRCFSDQRAAKVGVQHRAGEIENGTQFRPRISRED